MKLLPRLALAAFLVVSIFGSAPVQSRAADALASDFQILPGDVLQINVWKEEGLDQELVVLPDGTITFPLIGAVTARGMTPSALQADVKRRLSAMIPDASVTVTVKSPLGHTVSVMGQVGKPGDIVIGRRTTVMQALSQAGGLTPFAKESDVHVLRTEGGLKMSIPVPYDRIAKGDDLDKDIDLKPGDIVFVPTAGLL